MVPGQQDPARRDTLGSGLQDGTIITKLQWCRLIADQHQNQMVLYAGLKITSFLSPPPSLQGYFKPRTFTGPGLPQSPHPFAPTRMRALKRKTAALQLSCSPLRAPTLPAA